MSKPRPNRRPRILCYDQRYFCRMTLWLELMVGIIMTILGLFILLLSMESLKAGDYAAVYFCSSFIVLGVALLLVYYIHYYALKLSVKRQVQKLDASIKSDQDALAALARRGLQFSKFAAVRQTQSTNSADATAEAADPEDAIVAVHEAVAAESGTAGAACSSAMSNADVATSPSSAVQSWHRRQDSVDRDTIVRFPQASKAAAGAAEDSDGMSNVSLADLSAIWETRQTTV